ncbi:hypothetical protein AVEN_199091-1 [Araneus ventricosus]|uniref:Uncharacterized protein n=1 Tax=Araneus ventricosus TaxID=182803 RepID=A0A4Y2VW40_ARAVE|nr:hypothetical protein AVEN_199091-1 [Araneus ventricosus]
MVKCAQYPPLEPYVNRESNNSECLMCPMHPANTAELYALGNRERDPNSKSSEICSASLSPNKTTTVRRYAAMTSYQFHIVLNCPHIPLIKKLYTVAIETSTNSKLTYRCTCMFSHIPNEQNLSTIHNRYNHEIQTCPKAVSMS